LDKIREKFVTVKFTVFPAVIKKTVQARVHRTIILAILCGCKTWSFTLSEEHSLRVFENRILRRIFGPKRDEATGGWRQLYNEGLHDLYCPGNFTRMVKSRRMRWAGHVARMRDEHWAQNLFYIFLAGNQFRDVVAGGGGPWRIL
jgi:hypothetical protein